MPETFLHGVEIVEIDSGTRPIQTVRSSVIGLIGTAPEADATAFPINTPTLIAGSRTEAAKLGTTGTLPDAIDDIFDQVGAVVVVVRVEEGADDAATLTNIIGGIGDDGHYQGVQAFLGAESVLGAKPKILIAPGFTGDRPEDPDNAGTYLANPVVSELTGIADRLRAIIVADGPNTTDEAAIAYAGDFGSKRIYLVDPGVKVLRDSTYVNAPASARAAGRIAWTDNNRGFWWSPSNQEISGISGTSRPVSFGIGDVNSRANLLNEANVATIIRQDGYRLWGNRTLSSDPRWAFLNVVRTADMINESLQQAHLWAVDRNITKSYFEDVTDGVNAYLRSLKAQGAILGGTCWADPELNSVENLQAGKVFFDFDFTPPAPAEHITFRSHMVNDYFEEVL